MNKFLYHLQRIHAITNLVVFYLFCDSNVSYALFVKRVLIIVCTFSERLTLDYKQKMSQFIGNTAKR